jgi:hypothetical protein
MNTRAHAAGRIAKAVQHVASTVTTQDAAEHENVQATVLWRIGGDQITSVEIEGRVFRPARDQVEERRAGRLEQIGRQLDALVGEAGAPLLAEHERLWQDRMIDVHDYLLRQVGFALMNNRLPSLWRCIYSQLSGGDDKYDPEAAETFLHIPEGEGVDYFDRGGSW